MCQLVTVEARRRQKGKICNRGSADCIIHVFRFFGLCDSALNLLLNANPFPSIFCLAHVPKLSREFRDLDSN